jgi:hypothetical protein
MKTKLIKINDIYTLLGEDNKMIASDDIDFQSDYKIGKLSKKNCDEIFGVVDVDKLTNDLPYAMGVTRKDQKQIWMGGFNKAIELNKDKLFTIEDMRKALITMQVSHNVIRTTEDREELIQSLRQPTEIDVEVVYQRACCSDNHTCGDEDNYMICTRTFPKLDSNGCLILKKI